MKPINNYIVERIRIDNINTYRGFPFSGTAPEVIDFLEYAGFERFDLPKSAKTLGSVVDEFDKREGKYFTAVNYGTINTVYFADMSKRPRTIYIFNIDDAGGILYRMYTNALGLVHLEGSEFAKRLRKDLNIYA
jgi:hypothetical protein